MPSAVESFPPPVTTMTAPLQRAFAGIRDAFPDADETRAEVAWSAMHGLSTLQASGRLRPSHVEARLDLAHRMLTQPEAH